jgi:ribosomal protein L11 methyltransferase
MTDYIEVKCNVEPIDPGVDILIAELSEIGFDSFVETEIGVLAYIKSELFDANKISALEILINPLFTITFSYNEVENQNWNAVWESNYTPVNIDNRCVIKAPFHTEPFDAQYQIEIEPKMSFGTAHHETTASVIRLMLDVDFTNKTVLDMGSGTGILAILASMMGASEIVAIDNDHWAYENHIENNLRNNIHNCEVVLGDASAIPARKFDIVLANINRNILLNDMHHYTEVMKSGSIIIFSGFYHGYDLEAITQKGIELGLSFEKNIVENNWTAAVFYKN